MTSVIIKQESIDLDDSKENKFLHSLLEIKEEKVETTALIINEVLKSKPKAPKPKTKTIHDKRRNEEREKEKEKEREQKIKIKAAKKRSREEEIQVYQCRYCEKLCRGSKAKYSIRNHEKRVHLPKGTQSNDLVFRYRLIILKGCFLRIWVLQILEILTVFCKASVLLNFQTMSLNDRSEILDLEFCIHFKVIIKFCS
jgi:hypothetical protein